MISWCRYDSRDMIAFGDYFHNFIFLIANMKYVISNINLFWYDEKHGRLMFRHIGFIHNSILKQFVVYTIPNPFKEIKIYIANDELCRYPLISKYT